MNKDTIIKYFSGELNREERIALLQALEQNSEFKQEFMAYRNLNALMALTRQTHDHTEGEKSYKKFHLEKKHKQVKRLFSVFTRYAACIILAIASTWIATFFYFDHKLQSEVQYNTLSVPAGQHATLVLSDGTEVWMNARSSIQYPSTFNQKERKVELKGEAYFKVTKNTECPFIVSTPSLNVNVLGTTFNIKCDENSASTDVSLMEGSVDVYFTGSRKKVNLMPMQNLSYKDGTARITKLENENDFLWKQGILFFDRVPLSEIARKIEWHYDIPVILNNEEIGKQIYSGKFRQQDGPYEILRILQKTNGFKLKKDDVKNIIEIK